MRIALALSLFLASIASAQPTTAPSPTYFDVTQFGAKPDGQSDCAAAFQQALDSAAKAGGGVVLAPRGNYLFKSHLNVPNNVTLKGIFESVPAHNGIRDRGMPKPTDDGTTFLVTEGQDKEDAPPFITLNTNSTLKGVCIYHPDQDPRETPKPYPYAVAMRGKNPAILDVELLNPYNAIDASRNERHLIRNVSGQPLRRGIYVDAIFDVGRIENVHFNPWWSHSGKVREFQFNNGEAFIFARTDWQYVLNTFCFGYKVGYKFAQTRAGVCNGNFLGIGADDCQRAVLVEQSAPFGLLITNGEFVAFNGPDPVMVEVAKTHSGTLRFVNCAFWGPCQQIARISGANTGTVAFSDCTFVQWDKERKGLHAIQADSGSLLIRGCEFRENKPQVLLNEGVRRAIVTGNLLTGPARITNNSKGSVVVSDNAPTP